MKLQFFLWPIFNFESWLYFENLTEFRKIKDANLERIAKSLLSRISNFLDFNSNGPEWMSRYDADFKTRTDWFELDILEKLNLITINS